MVVAMLPLDIAQANPGENLARVKRMLTHLRDNVSVIVLPELFSTGFLRDKAEFELLAEPIDGSVMNELRELSAQHNAAISGSLLCREKSDGTLRNRAFFINPDDGCNVTFYDKHHLFSLSPEKELFKEGETRFPVVDFRKWHIALSICFDLRFPAWCRNIGNEYDMMIFPANWPDSRFYAWKHLLIARAIENQAVMVGCNRSGCDHFGSYSYLSTMAVNERGVLKTEVHGNCPIRYATFDIDELREFRQKFPVNNGADKFTFID